jgi:RNA polymerase sigma-70 factor (ECF subfamily)
VPHHLAKGMEVLSDALLMERVVRRDAEAFVTLYRRYRLRVFSLILHMVKDRGHAEEILQDVFQRLWDRGEQYQAGQGQLLSWLLSVARNCSIDFLRKESRRGGLCVSMDEEFQQQAMQLAGHAMDAETVRSVRQALEALPPEQSRVLELTYFEGLTQQEMAEELGESLGTIKTRVRLGMEKLKQAVRVGILGLL